MGLKVGYKYGKNYSVNQQTNYKALQKLLALAAKILSENRIAVVLDRWQEWERLFSQCSLTETEEFKNNASKPNNYFYLLYKTIQYQTI